MSSYSNEIPNWTRANQKNSLGRVGYCFFTNFLSILSSPLLTLAPEHKLAAMVVGSSNADGHG